MKNVIAAALAVLMVAGFSTVVFGGECPEINSSLRFKLYKEFPDFEIAFPETFAQAEQQQLEELTGSKCAYLVLPQTSVYIILLRNKLSNLYQIVAAEPVLKKSGDKWSVKVVSRLSGDIPVLDTARGGYYADVVSGDKLTITRNSMAVQVTLLNCGEKYIYKENGDDGFERCRIK